MNKIVECINKIKESLKYHWSLFKNTIEIYMEVESSFLKIKWVDKYEGLTLSKFMPCKRFSEVFKELIYVIKAYMPEEREEIDEFLKEIDKKVKIDLITYNALLTLLENKYEVDYRDGNLTISITKGEYYFILTINEEFIRALKEVINDPELLMDCVPSFIKEWVEEEEKKTSKKNKFKNQVMTLHQTYSEFLDEDSKNVNFSDEYWEIVFKNPGEGYPDDINLDFDSEQWDIDRAKKYLKQWKDELPKIQEQKEREALVKEIGDKYPGNISYEGYDIYKVRVNNQSFKIDVAETPINEIKSIMAKLSKTQNN